MASVGLTVGEILTEIIEKVSHNLSDESIIRKINELQKEIFRKYSRVATVEKINMKTGFGLYTLPCPLSNFIEVLVEGKEYKYRNLYEKDDIDQFYYSIKNALGIYPTPKKDLDNGILVYFWKQPVKLTVNDMDIYPELDADFHLLLVYGICMDIEQDDKKSAKFAVKYHTLLKELKDSYAQEPEQLKFTVE